MDMNLVVTLLTIIVVILSVVVVALLATMTIILIKVQRVIKSIDVITQNLASATEWLSPGAVIGHIVKLFRK